MSLFCCFILVKSWLYVTLFCFFYTGPPTGTEFSTSANSGTPKAVLSSFYKGMFSTVDCSYVIYFKRTLWICNPFFYCKDIYIFFRQIVKISQVLTVRSTILPSFVILKEFTTCRREGTVVYIADSVKV